MMALTVLALNVQLNVIVKNGIKYATCGRRDRR